MKGKFITIEGIDGAGKSQILDAITDTLESAGISVVVTREPGGTAMGEAVRELLLKSNCSIGGDAETLLVFAARAQHIEEVIAPGIADGKWIVCDRFTDSTYAYQGGGRHIPAGRIEVLENWVQRDLRPDLTLFMDAAVEIGRQRTGQQSGHDRFESEYDETDDFFARVRQAYHELSVKNPCRIHVVDSSRTPEEVQAEVIEIMKRYLDSDVT